MDQTAVSEMRNRAIAFIQTVEQKELENAAAIKSRKSIEDTINNLIKGNESNKEALDIAQNAIAIIKKISDEAVTKAYNFLQESLNSSLKKMFENTTRRIELHEYLRSNQYPQLELILHVGNGKTRSLKTDSGHGLAQIVSLLSILSLIVITGARRVFVMDEIISGLSVRNRQVVNDILWSFTEIGFQFIVNEHGFIPEGSNVYHLEMVGDVSGVKHNYIAKKGVYLQGSANKNYDYKESDLVPVGVTFDEEIDTTTGEVNLTETDSTQQTVEETKTNDTDTNGYTEVLSI